MLNGPVFEAGAGWGTRFGLWIRGNLVYILPGIVVLVLIIVFAFNGGSQNVMETERPMSSEIQTGNALIRETVVPGDSYTTVARRMIKNMLAAEQSGQISKGTMLYAETEMSRVLQSQTLNVGNKISTTRDIIWSYINGFENLYPSQKAKWEAMASRVRF